MSAKSAKTTKSVNHIPKIQGRGHGFFGDDNDKDKEAVKQKERESNFLVRSDAKTTDVAGSVTFYNVPIGKYSLIIKGNHEY